MNQFVRSLTMLLLFSITFHGFAQETCVSPDRKKLVALPINLYGRTEWGVPTGIVAETLDEVLNRMGCEHHFINMRSRDAIRFLKDGKLGVVAALYRTTEALDVGLITDPIIIEYNIVIIRKGEKVPFNKISDLNGKVIGIRASNPYRLPEKCRKADKITLQRFESKGDILRSLILGQVDAAIISSLSDIYDFRAEGIMDQIDILERAVGIAPISTVLSKQMFSQEDIASFNHHLAALQQDSAWGHILDQNGFTDLLHPWPLLEE